MNANGKTYFNLVLGNWDEETNTIDDTIVSNNQDADRILATVASTVVDFINQFPDTIVFAKGSTPARTKLYQMGISKSWSNIDAVLKVYGLYNKINGSKSKKCEL